jgi:hypothetical protein
MKNTAQGSRNEPRQLVLRRSDLGLNEHQIKDLHERGVVVSAPPQR